MDSGNLSYPLWDKEKRNWYEIKNRIAYVPQYFTEWEGSLLDNIRLEASSHGLIKEANKEAVEYIIHRLGLQSFIGKTWNELSGGYKLRFNLARALVWKPDLLILDEPLAYLDIKAQIIVLNDLKNMSKSLNHPISVLLTSQHLHEVERVVDYIYFLHDGKITKGGKNGEIYLDSQENKFILETNSELSQIQTVFENRIPLKVQFNGFEYLLTTDRNTKADSVLKLLLESGIPIRYFRDVSDSIIREFKG